MSFSSIKTMAKTITLIVLAGTLLYSYSAGPPPARTGGFGEATCVECHNSFLLNAGRALGGTFDILGVPAQYTPGATYPITVRIAHPPRFRWGFELAVRFESDGTQAGQIIRTDPARTQIQTFQNVQYISHTLFGTDTGIMGPITWTFDWQAPTTGGSVIFHAAGNATNSDGTPFGDYIYTDSKTSQRAGGGNRNEPYSVIAADLNGDDVPDIIRLNQGSNNITVLLGVGDGTFEALPEISVGSKPWVVVAADVNGDGVPDLITANGQSNNVSVLIGNGDGTFVPAVTYPVGGLEPRGVVAADLNGDGIPDLVTANFNSSNIAVLLNNGDGTFAVATPYIVPPMPHYVSAGDLNGDGIADLIVSSYNPGLISVLLSNGDGTLALPVTYSAGGAQPNTSVVADFNGDRNLDVAVANHGSDNVSVFLGDGSGALGTPTTIAAGGGPFGLAAGDVDNDGTIDLVTANSNTNDVSILIGNGLGEFTRRSNESVGSFPRSVAIADVDGDGNVDIIVANTNDHSLMILFGDGEGGVARVTTLR